MGVLYKRGKVWYLDVRAGGRRVRRRLGASKKVAELALKDAEIKIARDEFGFGKKDIPVEKFLAKFLEYSEANHSIATRKRYRAVIDHFQRFLSDKPEIVLLSQIGAKELDEYKMFRKQEWVNPNGMTIESEEEKTAHTRKGARAHTINFEIGVLQTVFNLAIKWSYLKENPTKDVVPLKVTDSTLPRLLTKDECQRLLKHSPAELKPIFFTFLNTGMRKGELENLTWEDVDFKRRKIKIRRKEFWKPKTGEREIPMNEAIYDLFQNLKKNNDKTVKSIFVFSSPDGTQLKLRLRERLIEVAQEAKIKGLTKIHSLRHAFASHLVMQGVDLPTVQKLMGHSDIQTTIIYSHLAPDHLADAVEKLPF
jgi:site-specific recombinase XerD